MNLEQAKLLSRMANHIKTVKRVHPDVPANWWADTEEDGTPVPGCLVCESVRARIFAPEDVEDGGKYDSLDFASGFSRHIGVTYDEASHVLRRYSAEGYYEACKQLLTKYNYAHLLEPEKVIPVKQIIPAYKDQFTPALEGFDWRNPVRDIA